MIFKKRKLIVKFYKFAVPKSLYKALGGNESMNESEQVKELTEKHEMYLQVA